MAVELFLLVISLLFFASIFTDKLSSKLGVPALLLLGALGIVSIWFAMLCELIVLCYTVFLSLKTFNY